MKKPLFVTGIGTGVGKTVVSAIVVEALGTSYWKPIQSGDLDETDSMKVGQWVSNPEVVIHPEAYRLTQPLSPHAAAAHDGVNITLDSLKDRLPSGPLVMEGAGGLMVPLNQHDFLIDFISHVDARVVLVSQHYLGSINHTVLSFEALTRRGIEVAGIVFNGSALPGTEEIILSSTGAFLIGRIQENETIGSEMVSRYAGEFRSALMKCSK